jgi:hypothetical protein
MSGRHRRLFVRLILLSSPLALLVLVGFVSLSSNSEDNFDGNNVNNPPQAPLRPSSFTISPVSEYLFWN